MTNEITYTHWLTGETITEPLSNEDITRRITHVYCPLDSTTILSCTQKNIHSYECPNCGEIYRFSKNITQAQAEKQAREKVQIARTNIDQLKEKQKRLERMVELAEQSNLFGELHKVGEGSTPGTAD